MPSPVQWSGDGVPSSSLYGDDIYHSEAGAIEQARFVFLGGCGLPEGWAGRQQFTVLELGFGLGLNFLATWQAWLADPQRAKRLDYVSIEAHPVTKEDILLAAKHQFTDETQLMALATSLADSYPMTLPGLHRIRFVHDGCQLVLTLAIGDATALLPELHLAADAVYMDGFSPALNPELWSPAICKGIARLMRPGGRAATWTIAAALRKGLAEAGFKVQKVPGLPPKRDALRATYAPAWPRPANWPDNAEPNTSPAHGDANHAIVIGAGLAGASTAYALSQRGWRVTLLDAHSAAAGGASGLPAGLMVPHVSPDDAPMSRLTRAGAALMRRWIDDIALPPRHWRADGVLQRVDDVHKARAPASWNGQSMFELRQAALDQQAARFFFEGVAVEPAALVRQLLASSPALQTRWNSKVAALTQTADGWQALDPSGMLLAQAPIVVVAASLDSLRIAGLSETATGTQILRPVRGQVTLGQQPLPADAMPAHPLSGDGYFVPALHPDSSWPWLVGASFERGETALEAHDEATTGNLEKLRRLLPDAAASVEDDFAPGHAHSWLQVRCASPDRMPLVGELPGQAGDPESAGLYMLAALGSRGLSLAAICAELLACRIAGDPWPVEASMARAVEPARFVK